MLQFFNKLIDLKRDEKGVTALEYGLIAALIAVVIVGAVSNLGGYMKTTFEHIGYKIDDANKNNQ